MTDEIFARLCIDDPSIVELDERDFEMTDFPLKLMGALCTNTCLQRLILFPRNAKEKERYEVLLAFALHINPNRPPNTFWTYADDCELTNIYCKLRYYKLDMILALLVINNLK